MDVREKLVELLGSVSCNGNGESLGSCPDRKYGLCGEVANLSYCVIQNTANHLIANGVTVQEWISVEDKLPDLIPCNAGTAYSEAVNVLTTGRKVLTAIFDGDDFICDAEFWEAEGEEITHWTPVLLPLPQPPKG